MWVEKHGRGFRIRDRIGDSTVTVRGNIATKTAAKMLVTTLRADKIRGDALVHRGGDITLATGWTPGGRRTRSR